ncbi:MAG: hypothetical protein K0S67_436 [Nitrososphaeraceae archaeon]|jgi:uncharacterized membrane protein|nr:hypothetical protein [Nitrososphaeraceae archaeon]MCD6036552.1 hypothetical protein [Nitrososphaeraceae archaeon]MDF2768994.1 hypothetical protein [Nitrososphaeraceae archaeon]
MVESGEGIAHIFLEQLIEYTVIALEIIITIIIIIIVGIALANLFKIMVSTLINKEEKEKQREYLGQLVRRMLRGLLISLDFLVAADLLKSILVPSVTELIILAFVVAIRIVLSWSLSKEIESYARQKKAL